MMGPLSDAEIDAYLDGRLTEEEADGFRAHLDENEADRQRVEERQSQRAAELEQTYDSDAGERRLASEDDFHRPSVDIRHGSSADQHRVPPVESSPENDSPPAESQREAGAEPPCQVDNQAHNQVPGAAGGSSSGGGSGSGSGSAFVARPSMASEMTMDDSSGSGGGSIHSANTQNADGVAEFERNLQLSGLLNADDLEDIHSQLTADELPSDAQSMADILVRKNKLTQYQAETLKKGLIRGLVLGNYVVLDKLGEGGMGMVFRARHRRMKRIVALKVLPPAMTESPDAIARFHREVEAAAKLQHANIAAAYDADEADGIHFMVMEYVEGPNLSSYIKQAGPMPVAVAVQVCIQTARGLAHAHEQGIVHRDIKPGNLLIGTDGVLKILDMGLARVNSELSGDADEMAELTQSGRVMGTVDYMAPEQALDAKAVDYRADIYSLGCTLYYLLVGAPMAPESTLTKKLLWHQNSPVPSLKDARPGVPDRLDQVFQRMMAKKPEDRQSSMGEVIQELERCFAELPKDDLELSFAGIELHPGTPSTDRSLKVGKRTFVQRPTATDVTRMVAQEQAEVRKNQLRVYGWVTGAVVLGILAIGGLLWTIASALGGGKGELQLSLNQPYVSVFVDGSRLGTTGADTLQPARFQVRKGERQIRVTKAGFAPFETSVRISTEEPTKLRVELLPNDATTGGGGRGKVPFENTLQWVFAQGGSVSVVTGRGQPPRQLKSLQEAPRKAFDLRTVNLSSTEVTDGELAKLADAPNIQNLSLAKTSIGDEGLKHLRRLRALWSLDLSDTNVTNDGLTQIVRLSQLRDLNLAGTEVTDQGLSRLSALTQLESLNLSDNRIGDTGAALIGNVPSLRKVQLNGTDVTDRGFEVLQAKLPKAEIAWDGRDVERVVALKLLRDGASLSLSTLDGNTLPLATTESDLPTKRFYIVGVDASKTPGFGDADLKPFVALVKLQRLDLTDTRVTSDGLAQLHGIGTLQRVNLGRLYLDKRSVDALKEALGNATIAWTPPTDPEVARWAVTTGGTISVRTLDGTEKTGIRTVSAIPAGMIALTEITLDGKTGVNDANLAKIGDLPRLVRLSLAGTAITDAGMPSLLGCRSLAELNLAGTEVSSTGCETLAQLKSLRKVWLDHSAVNGTCIAAWASVPELTHLSLEKTDLADKDLAPLQQITGLSWLNLTGTQITDGALEPLSALTWLGELWIEETAFTNRGIIDLERNLPQCEIRHDPLDAQRQAARWVLRYGGNLRIDTGEVVREEQLPVGPCVVLQIDLAEVESMPMAQLPKVLSVCTELTDLNLAKTKFSDAEIDGLVRLKRLVSLSLAATTVSDDGLKKLAELTQLVSLDLNGTRVAGPGFAALRGIGNLRRLDLGHSHMDDRGVTYLRPFTQLTELDLGYTQVSDQGVTSLAGMRQLESLVLRNTRITDSALSTVKAFSRLKFLDVSSTKVTEGGASGIRSALPGCKVVNVAQRLQQEIPFSNVAAANHGGNSSRNLGDDAQISLSMLSALLGEEVVFLAFP